MESRGIPIFAEWQRRPWSRLLSLLPRFRTWPGYTKSAGVGMDPNVGEAVDRNGACSLGHLGYGFRLHPVAPSLPTVRNIE